MNGNTNKVALLVHSCDRYRFLYKGFEYFFSRHWDFAIPLKYYFATEEETAEVKGFENIQSGKGEWTNRLRVLLKKIPEDYIIYMQEDMWLNKDINPNFFKKLFNLTIENGWKQVKLNSSKVYETIATSIFIEGFNIAIIDNKTSDYLMSHQITLWDKQFLLQQLVKGEHPWRNERKGTKRLKKISPTIFHADVFMENGMPENNKNTVAAKRSGYWTVSENGMLNSRVLSYIKVLNEGNEDEKNYGRQLMFNFENELTHDGKPKPRKEDLYQKIKKWIRKKIKQV
jgi:hypothetical protein